MTKEDKIKKYFNENGYLLVPNLITKDKINNLLQELKILKSRNTIYYSQSEHNWRFIKDDLDDSDLLNCSFENFTDILWEKKLAKAGKKILQSKEIGEYLKKISNYNNFSIWQNMFFDKSTGTIDHLDSYYLDTNPYGELIACWVALEDIDGDGGAFHVYPKSHKNYDFDWKNMNHNEFINWSKKASEKYKRKSIYMKKGDTLFWHPFLIHGSSEQKVVGKSRKSITAHYFPINFLKGGKGANDSQESETYKRKLKHQTKHYRELKSAIISSKRKRDITFFSLKGLIKVLLSFKNNPHKLMNRLNYKEY